MISFKEFLEINEAQQFLDIDSTFNEVSKKFPFIMDIKEYVDRIELKGKKKVFKFYNDYKDDIETILSKYVKKRNDSSGHDIYDLDKEIQIISTGSKKSNSNMKSLGKAFNDAVELATILSLTKDIKTPGDTEQQVFIDNPSFFDDWKATFTETKKAVQSLCGNISNFDILHDATDNSGFARLLRDIQVKAKSFSTKDSWCPADIYLIKKSETQRIKDTLRQILTNFEKNDILTEQTNAFLYNEVLNKNYYPISLKQIKKTAKIKENNVPKDVPISTPEIEIKKINVDMSADKKEIGLFTFDIGTNNSSFDMQIRCFPYAFGTVQTEITSFRGDDSNKSGGAVGKVPVSVIDKVMSKYNDERIKSVAFFGKNRDNTEFFTNFDKKRIEEVYGWFLNIKKSSKCNIVTNLSLKDFTALIDEARTNEKLAYNMCSCIQGLKFVNFFIKNENNISQIMSAFLNGAQKIGKLNAFFYKIF